MNNKIAVDRLKLLNDYMLLSIPANFLCTLIVFFGLYQTGNHYNLIIWFIAASSAFIAHIGFFLSNRSHPLNPTTLLRGLICLAVIYGALWGIAGSVLIPSDNVLKQMLVIIIISGITSGGIQIFQANITASILFLTLTILPLITWLFYQNSPTYFLLGLAILIYLFAISLISSIGYKILNNNFKLKYENTDLINKLFKINASLEESQSRFRAAFDFAAIGMGLLSIEGRWIKVNKSLCNIVGYSEEELLKKDFQSITYPADLGVDLNYVQQLIDGKIRSYNMEKRYIRKNGSIIWILLSGSLIRDAQDTPIYFIAQIQNIDVQKRAEQELNYIAHHDVLTGLANRKQLAISFELALAYAKRHKKTLALMFMDLDDFKQVNDNLGHDIGDLLLIETGKILKKTLRSTDIIVRQGGDEFILVLTDLINQDHVIMVAKKISIALAKPIHIKEHEILITVSIGISLFPHDGDDLTTLIKQADDALYCVKSTGKNNFKLIRQRP